MEDTGEKPRWQRFTLLDLMGVVFSFGAGYAVVGFLVRQGASSDYTPRMQFFAFSIGTILGMLLMGPVLMLVQGRHGRVTATGPAQRLWIGQAMAWWGLVFFGPFALYLWPLSALALVAWLIFQVVSGFLVFRIWLRTP
jgi:hypothetical protein